MAVHGGPGDPQCGGSESPTFRLWKCSLILHPPPDRRPRFLDPSLFGKIYDFRSLFASSTSIFSVLEFDHNFLFGFSEIDETKMELLCLAESILNVC